MSKFPKGSPGSGRLLGLIFTANSPKNLNQIIVNIGWVPRNNCHSSVSRSCLGLWRHNRTVLSLKSVPFTRVSNRFPVVTPLLWRKILTSQILVPSVRTPDPHPELKHCRWNEEGVLVRKGKLFNLSVQTVGPELTSYRSCVEWVIRVKMFSSTSLGKDNGTYVWSRSEHGFSLN